MEVRGVGGEGDYMIIYLSLHCHHQNDSCIKEDTPRNRTEVLLLASLTTLPLGQTGLRALGSQRRGHLFLILRPRTPLRDCAIIGSFDTNKLLGDICILSSSLLTSLFPFKCRLVEREKISRLPTACSPRLRMRRGFALDFNPFTAPACKISRLKNGRTRLQTVYFVIGRFYVFLSL